MSSDTFWFLLLAAVFFSVIHRILRTTSALRFTYVGPSKPNNDGILHVINPNSTAPCRENNYEVCDGEQCRHAKFGFNVNRPELLEKPTLAVIERIASLTRDMGYEFNYVEFKTYGVTRRYSLTPEVEEGN